MFPAAEQAQLLPLAQLLAQEIHAATDGAILLPVSPAPPPAATSASPAILLSLSPSAGGANTEAYALSITTESGASLTASAYVRPQATCRCV